MKKLILSAAVLALTACQSEPAEQHPDVTVFPAASVVTMTGEGDVATAVAIRQDKIVGVGNLESLTAEFSGSSIDESFKNKNILPGLIDPHMHTMLGGLFYAQPFAPPWPMAMPGGMTNGFDTPGKFHARLAEIVAAAPTEQEVILAYGFHNLVQGDLDRKILDRISPDRPLVVWHYSGHDFYLNSAAIEFVGVTPALAETYHGVDLYPDGELTGRIYEDAVMNVFDGIAPHVFRPQDIARGLNTYFAIMRNSGITTTADLGYGIFGRENENATIGAFWSMEKNAFRLYLIPEHRAFTREFGDDAPKVISELVSGDRPAPAPVLPRVKFFTDGAFYSQTMRLSPPGYLAGQSQGSKGLWVTEPGELYAIMRPYLEAGLSAHVHSNGDAAQTETLNAFQEAREAGLNNDFVVEHGGLFTDAHTTQAADNGVMLSAASHYVHYMGEAYEAPLGKDRADRISPLGELSRKGGIVTIHSDAPLAPPDPLLAASRHITRKTLSGSAYEPEQSLTPYDAMEAITLDAARALGLSSELGTIEIGKKADFTIVDTNPLTIDAENWDSIAIWGVVLGGKKRPLN
ncbi:MAG: amidohydrolase family protein [Hellea sp.]|nr:amidohydrolase family protein [Hellea sp.]